MQCCCVPVKQPCVPVKPSALCSHASSCVPVKARVKRTVWSFETAHVFPLLQGLCVCGSPRVSVKRPPSTTQESRAYGRGGPKLGSVPKDVLGGRRRRDSVARNGAACSAPFRRCAVCTHYRFVDVHFADVHFTCDELCRCAKSGVIVPQW